MGGRVVSRGVETHRSPGMPPRVLGGPTDTRTGPGRDLINSPRLAIFLAALKPSDTDEQRVTRGWAAPVGLETRPGSHRLTETTASHGRRTTGRTDHE